MTAAAPTLVIVWRVTERCNLGCRFCAYDRGLERPRRDADPIEVLRLGALLVEHAARAGLAPLVSWLGGEPYLWPALEAATGSLRSLGARIGITSNATLLAAGRWREWTLASVDELTLSLDGPSEVHDWARRAPGSAARILTLIAELRRRRDQRRLPLRLRVNTILMRQNVDGAGALCDALAAAGADEVTFNQLGGNDRPEFYPAHRLLPEQVARFVEGFESLRERLRAKGVTLRGGPAYLERFRATAAEERLPIEDCQPGARFLFIDELGRVAPCSFTPEGYGVRGDTLLTVADIGDLPGRWRAMRAARRLAPCLDCHSTQVFDKFTEPAERVELAALAPAISSVRGAPG